MQLIKHAYVTQAGVGESVMCHMDTRKMMSCIMEKTQKGRFYYVKLVFRTTLTSTKDNISEAWKPMNQGCDLFRDLAGLQTY